MTDIRYEIGNTGEEIVHEFFKNAVRSSDWYDSEKDGTIGIMTYEVKTMRLNIKTKSFWVGQNTRKTMWQKLDNVDLLFFIKVPESLNERSVLYLCIDHKNCWEKQHRNDGTPCRGYPLNKCIALAELDIKRSNILYENSLAISKHRRFNH